MNIVVLSAVLLLLDVLWISSMWGMYGRMIQNTMGMIPEYRKHYAILAYAAMIAAVVSICRPLAKVYTRPWTAYAVTGLVIYAVYNFTNAAIFIRYPNRVVLVDTLWGACLFAVVGVLDTML